MSWFSRLFGGEQPADGDTRELAEPQHLDGMLWWERTATHEIYDAEAGTWQPAVVDRWGGRDHVVPAMRTWPDENE